jgi:hypothetical protein
LKDRIPPSVVQALRVTYQDLTQNHPNLDILQILNEIDYIPSAIFSKKLGSLESIVKYLHENRNLSFAKIGTLLNRNSKSIWNSYHNANKKSKSKIEIDSSYYFPAKILQNRNMGVLQSIVLFFHDNLKLTFHEIAEIMERDDRTIWVSYHTALKKKK